MPFILLLVPSATRTSRQFTLLQMKVKDCMYLVVHMLDVGKIPL